MGVSLNLGLNQSGDLEFEPHSPTCKVNAMLCPCEVIEA